MDVGDHSLSLVGRAKDPDDWYARHLLPHRQKGRLAHVVLLLLLAHDRVDVGEAKADQGG